MSDQVGISSVSGKGQVTIPKEIRDSLRLKPGDKIVFIERSDEIVIQKAKTRKLSDTLGNQKPWKLNSIEFQRKAKREWSK